MAGDEVDLHAKGVDDLRDTLADADFAEFWRDVEWMGVQRHLKVLGIFARLHYRDAKRGYLEDTPRFVTYLRHAAARYRELQPLAAQVRRVVEALDMLGQPLPAGVKQQLERAERLNTNLALPEAEKTIRPTSTDAVAPNQLKPPVIRLGRLIFSFVDNPFFKEASVVDTQLTAKARRDLEDIIELSGQIKKSTEQLGKSRQ